MKFKLRNLVFYFIVLMQLSCAHKEYQRGRVPEWGQFHSKHYPCPENTISIGDPRFPNHFVCRETGANGEIGIILR
jgi:hypothetical protein